MQLVKDKIKLSKLKEMSQKMFHENLADRWKKMPLLEQLANIGSEVSRAIRWKEKDNPEMFKNAVYRSLELFDLTLQSPLTYPQLKEVARAREAWLDFILFDNQYNSTAQQWLKYFDQFAIAWRNRRGT